MKKTIIILLTIISISILIFVNNYKVNNKINDIPKEENNKSNLISMMLETEAGTGKYKVSESNSWPTEGYVFNSEKSKCENGGELSWNKDTNKVILKGNISDKCYVYFDLYSPFLTEYVVSLYTGTQGENNIYYHNNTLTNSAEDNSYRYAGANPNNYVCFGSDEETCPYENLYRIIGVIDGKVKLILADGATTEMLGTDGAYVKIFSKSTTYHKGEGDLTKIGEYKFNATNTNTWSTSTLYTTNLSVNYLSYLDGINTKWKDIIDDTTWYVGGLTSANGISNNAKTAFDYEVGANKNSSVTITSKIGLMYLSDYYYGATPEYWTYPAIGGGGNNYAKAFNDNWMVTGLSDFTISRVSDYSYAVFILGVDGTANTTAVNYNYVVRPTFNILPEIKYSSGSGLISDPIRIN